MRLLVTGTSQALKDIERAQVLLRELGDVIRRIDGISFADVKSETAVEGDKDLENE